MNYSGLDVGKNTFDASLMSADEKEVSHNSFDNTPGGIQALLAWIASHQLSLYPKFCFVPRTWAITSRNCPYRVCPWDFPWL